MTLHDHHLVIGKFRMKLAAKRIVGGREVKQKVKKDSNKWVDDLAQQAEEAAVAYNAKELCNLNKIMAGKKNRCNSMPVRDNDGKLLS